MKLKASIIIPTYNKSKYLSKVLTTLKMQMDDRFEIIVVDDGSTDSTENVIKDFDVRYINQRHIGYGSTIARNHGARVAKADYLIFLDDDIVVCSDFLTKALEGKNRFEKRVVQAGYIWDYTGKGDIDIRTQYGVWERPGILTKRYYHVNGGNFSIYKSLYWEAGGNDEDFIYQGLKDTLFGYLISLLPDTYVVYNHEMTGFHLPHPKNKLTYNEAKNLKIMKRKYPDFYDDYVVKGLR